MKHPGILTNTPSLPHTVTISVNSLCKMPPWDWQIFKHTIKIIVLSIFFTDQQKEQLKTTLELVESSSSWSSSAYNTFWNFTGAVANMMQKEPEDSKRKRLLSADSSDGFEMIDKNDLT